MKPATSMEDFPCSSSQQRYAGSSNYGIYLSSSMEDDLSESQSYTRTSNLIRWKSGKRVDPKLLALLESFTEIYMNRHEFFKKIFHENQEELFEKISDAMKRRKEMRRARSMPRSRSMRAIRQRGVDGGIDGMRLERFKVKTPNVIVAAPDVVDPAGQGGQDQATQGSKDAK